MASVEVVRFLETWASEKKFEMAFRSNGRQLQKVVKYLLVLTLVMTVIVRIPRFRASVPAEDDAPVPGSVSKRSPEAAPDQDRAESVQGHQGDPGNDPGHGEVIKTWFRRADTTADGRLSQKEIAWTMTRNVERHLQQALTGNFKTFFAIDKVNKNGQVEWDEWLQYFGKVTAGADQRRSKQMLAAAKAAWSEAARANPEALNIDEFLSFTHPESSHSILSQSANEMFSRLDADSDGQITLTEYLEDPFVDLTPAEVQCRKDEFVEGMDSDKDGVVIKRELVMFLDPKNPYKAMSESKELLDAVDDSGDGYAQLEEIERHYDSSALASSKLVSAERAFHGDLNWNKPL